MNYKSPSNLNTTATLYKTREAGLLRVKCFPLRQSKSLHENNLGIKRFATLVNLLNYNFI